MEGPATIIRVMNLMMDAELTPWRQNTKVHHRIHMNPPVVPILSQLNPLYNPPQPISLRTILIPSSHLYLSLSSGLFPLGFSTKTLYRGRTHLWNVGLLQ